MEKLRTYKDFANDDYNYFMFAFKQGFIANSMGSQAQNICERYLKYIIDEYFEPASETEAALRDHILKSHNLNKIEQFMNKNMDITFSEDEHHLLREINGFYFTTRYPGDESLVLTKPDIALCAKAIESTKKLCENLEKEAQQLISHNH